MNTRNHSGRLLLLPLTIASASAVLAAGYSVKSVVSEQASGEPCIGATVKIYQPNDSTATTSFGVTDENGAFNREVKSPGEYVAEVQYLGCTPLSVAFKVDDENPDAVIENLSLLPDSDTTLEELTVVARRKLVKSDGATLTYNVEEDPTSKSSSTLEMLRNVPMVTVDAQDNIKVNGQSNFKIFINGKEDPMLNGDVKTVLKSLPASTIKRIEVITEPGAKYDAEGTGGILNIVTTSRTAVEGYLANINLNVSSQNAGGSVYAMTKVNKVTASVQGFAFHSTFHRYVNSLTETERLDSETERLETNRSRWANFPYGNYGGSLNLSWEPDTLNLYTVAFNAGTFTYDADNTNHFTMQDATMNPVWSYRRDYSVKQENVWVSGTASYQHTFGRQGHHLIMSYIYDYGTNNSTSLTETKDAVGISFAERMRSNIQDYNNSNHTLQIDYANPFNKKHLLEVGFKGTWRPQNGNTLQSAGPTAEEMTPDESQHVRLRQFQDVMAAYAAYTGTFGSWTLKGGVRYEHTHMGVDYSIGDYPDFSTNLNDVVPDAAITYRFSGATNLRLGYAMRISRPWLQALNPYRNTMTYGEVSYGNPDLDSEHGHTVSLSYSNYGGAVGGSVRTGYSTVNNGIERYQFVDPKGLINETYANIGHLRTWDVGGNMQWNPNNSLSIGFSGSLYYKRYRADSELLTSKAQGWEGNVSANANYTFPFGMRLSGWGGWGSRDISLQSTSGDGWYYYGIGISREFLKENRLNVQVYASNMFTPHQTYRQVNETAGLRITSSGRYSSWFVGLGVSYRLGSLQAHVKSTDAKISDDGAQGGGSSSGANGAPGVGRN